MIVAGGNAMADLDLRPRPRDRAEPIETASVDELRALQLERLNAAIPRALQVPHYRKKFAAVGINPADVKSLDDLAKLPFTTKEDLRQNYPFGMFAVPMDEIVRIHASSGTTGKPTVVGYTRGDIDTWSMLMARSIRAAGGKPGDKMHIAYGYGLFTGGLGFHYGAEFLGCAVIPVSGGFTERQVQLIVDFEPDIIAVTPSYLLAIADEFDRQGIDARKSSLRIALLGAEPWTEGDARRDRAAHGSRRRQRLWTLGSDRSRRRPGICRQQGWADDLGRPFFSRDHRSGHRQSAAGRRRGRTGLDLADQRSDAGDPLPHARFDAASCPARGAPCAASNASRAAATTC